MRLFSSFGIMFMFFILFFDCFSCYAFPDVTNFDSTIEKSANSIYNNILVEGGYADVDSVSIGNNQLLNSNFRSFHSPFSSSNQLFPNAPTVASHPHRTQPYYQPLWNREIIPTQYDNQMIFPPRKRKRVDSKEQQYFKFYHNPTLFVSPLFRRQIQPHQSSVKSRQRRSIKRSMLNSGKYKTHHYTDKEQQSALKFPQLMKQMETNTQPSRQEQQSSQKLDLKTSSLSTSVVSDGENNNKQHANVLQSIPDYFSLLTPELKPKTTDYEELFNEWKKRNKKLYSDMQQEKVAYQQFKIYVDLETFAEGKLPIIVWPNYADRDLLEYLTEKYKEYKGSNYDPIKDKIDLHAIFNSCSFFLKNPTQLRYARFLRNTFKRLNWIEEIFNPQKQLCFRRGDRSAKEKSESHEFVVTEPPPDTDNTIVWFT